MSVEVIMPKLGLTMDEGTVVQWLVAEGDVVEKGQPLLEVETDKVTVEVEAPASGTMGPLLVGEGKRVPVGTPLAHIYQAEAMASTAPAKTVAVVGEEQRETTVPPEKELLTPLVGRQKLPAHRRQRVFSSPRARKRAKELGIDWQRLAGSGTGGRVVERDVLRAAAQQQAVEAAPQAATAAAKALVSLTASARLDALLELHRRLSPVIEQRAGVQLAPGDWLVRAVAAALAGPFEPPAKPTGPSVQVAIAMLAPREVVVATLPAAACTSLARIAVERRAVEEAARTGRPIEIQRPSRAVVVADLSSYRIDTLAAPLGSGQAALVTLGRWQEVASLSFSCDQRLFTWPQAVRFVERLAATLEEPYLLLA